MQLALPVSLPVDQTFASFYSNKDEQVANYLECLFDSHKQISVPLSVICGSSGTGKSHLLFSLCHLSDTKGISCMYVNLAEHADLIPQMMLGLEEHQFVCLDNLHCIAGQFAWETAIFDLVNRVCETKQAGGDVHLVITMESLPNHCNIQLPDLLSRLNWGTTFTLVELDDSSKETIIRQRAQHQGINITDAACRFLLHHYDRNLGKLMDFLDKLDVMSLQSKRKVTVPMLRNIIS